MGLGREPSAYRHLIGPPPRGSGAPQPLWGGAAKLVGAGFTPKGSFDSIYLADDPITAFIEVSALVVLPGGVNLIVFPERLAGSPSDFLDAYAFRKRLLPNGMEWPRSAN